MQPLKNIDARSRSVTRAMGQSSHAYQGTLMSRGGSKPGGYVFSSTSSITAILSSSRSDVDRGDPPEEKVVLDVAQPRTLHDGLELVGRRPLGDGVGEVLVGVDL